MFNASYFASAVKQQQKNDQKNWKRKRSGKNEKKKR